MKIRELLVEAKARIQHPEDEIFDDGSQGALNAIESLKDAVISSKNISLKIDGSPALIAGYINKVFVMTDKAGLAKQKFPSSPEEIFDMLLSRKPDQQGREKYSSDVANLFSEVKKIIPMNFSGLTQFDVLWFHRPQVINDVYQFKPNKVLYQVPVNSELGKKISHSNFGICIHSYFTSYKDEEPHAINDFQKIGLKENYNVVVLNTKISFEAIPNKKILSLLKKESDFIIKFSNKIDLFFDHEKLSELKISNLASLMKEFLAKQASIGKIASKSLNVDFIKWIQNYKLSDTKKNSLNEYIISNKNIYNLVWNIVLNIVILKDVIRKNLEKQTNYLSASIHDVPSQEGYVIDAPSGKIKLVNRPLFMGALR